MRGGTQHGQELAGDFHKPSQQSKIHPGIFFAKPRLLSREVGQLGYIMGQGVTATLGDVTKGTPFTQGLAA